MSSKSALLLIDIQLGFNETDYWGPRSNPSFEDNTAKLLAAFRNAPTRLLVVHVCHHSVLPQSPLQPKLPGAAFQPYASPIDGEPIFSKTVNSAFIGTDLEGCLRGERISRLYVAGLTTGHCVSTSIRMANNLKVCDGDWGKGEIFLVKDAAAAHAAGEFDAETIHAVNVATLNGEFCTAITTDEALSRLI